MLKRFKCLLFVTLLSWKNQFLMYVLANPIFQNISKTSLKLSSQEQQWEESLLFRNRSTNRQHTNRQTEEEHFEIRQRTNSGSLYDNLEEENIYDFAQRLAISPSTVV